MWGPIRRQFEAVLQLEHVERARIPLLIGDKGHAEAAALADVLLERAGAHLGEHVGRRAGAGMRQAVLGIRAPQPDREDHRAHDSGGE